VRYLERAVMSDYLRAYRPLSQTLEQVSSRRSSAGSYAGALAPDKLPFPVRQFRYVQRSGKSFVEINDEVKIKAQVRVTRALAVGEPMTLSDMHADECFLQPPEVDGKPAA
jgi:hypothetical protein